MKRIVLMFFANFFRLPYMLFMVIHTSHHRSFYSRERRYAILHRFVKWANWGGRVHVEVEGTENLPSDSSYIMFPNHQGLYDVLTLLQAITVPFSPIVKIEIEHTYLLRNVLQMLDAEYMDREDLRQSMKVIQTVAARVRDGQNFIIFPEGTRSRRGNEMIDFKPGAFKAATMAKCPIVPVALVNCFVPFDEPHTRPVAVHAYILPPIYYEEYREMNTREIAALVQERIRECIKEHT